jgi:hypothetical protein
LNYQSEQLRLTLARGRFAQWGAAHLTDARFVDALCVVQAELRVVQAELGLDAAQLVTFMCGGVAARLTVFGHRVSCVLKCSPLLYVVSLVVVHAANSAGVFYSSKMAPIRPTLHSSQKSGL